MKLTYAGFTLKEKDKDFHALEVLEEILSADMKGKLFEIRANTGIFYSIDCSLTKKMGDDRCYFYISTLIYKENLTILETEIENLFHHISKILT